MNPMHDKINKHLKGWLPPELNENIPYGDMPGDKIQIVDVHIKNAKIIFPRLLAEIKQFLNQSNQEKIVISVSGGSGVGKSGIAALLSFYLNEAGIGSYTLSGDNYPHRIPEYNDAERYQFFEKRAFEFLRSEKIYCKEETRLIKELLTMTPVEANSFVAASPWLSKAIEAGKKALQSYLGTEKEIDFNEINQIITDFKNGENEIALKRMGRKVGDLWYDLVDFSNTKVLVIEWTHGNNNHLKGIDIPILLHSTPEETLASRIERNRDQNTDSVFVDCVLDIEQRLLHTQAHKAKIILTRTGEIIDYDKYLSLMNTYEREEKL